MNYRARIQQIAKEYHQAALEPDMFIENAIQIYESQWVMSRFSEGARFLEMGVGDGVTMERLSGHFDYEVVEGASSLVKVAEKFSRSSKRNFNVHHSWFEEFKPDHTFDLIYASHVLEHIENPVELLTRMKSWLSPEGELIVIVPNSESLHRRLGVQLGAQDDLNSLSARDHKVGHLRVYSLDSLKEDLSKGGFHVVYERGFFVKPLANAQLTHLSKKIVTGLCSISDSIDARICANLCVIAKATTS